MISDLRKVLSRLADINATLHLIALVVVLLLIAAGAIYSFL